MILVDHNERGQAVNGVETAEILEIIDHHRLGAIQTVSPVFLETSRLAVRQRLFIICIRKIRRKLIKIQRRCCVRQSFPIH